MVLGPAEVARFRSNASDGRHADSDVLAVLELAHARGGHTPESSPSSGHLLPATMCFTAGPDASGVVGRAPVTIPRREPLLDADKHVPNVGEDGVRATCIAGPGFRCPGTQGGRDTPLR